MNIDSKLTIGNIITISTLVISMIAAATMYTSTIDAHSTRLTVIEKNQDILANRITLLEQQMSSKQNQLDSLQTNMNRTVQYLQLLLDKQHVQYIK